jgi:hypothetical protein
MMFFHLCDYLGTFKPQALFLERQDLPRCATFSCPIEPKLVCFPEDERMALQKQGQSSLPVPPPSPSTKDGEEQE